MGKSQVERDGPSSFHNPLNLERIDDTSLAEGKKINYFTSKKWLNRPNPRDYVSIKDNGSHICYVCFKHRFIMIALLSEAMCLPKENWDFVTLRPVDNKTGVTILYKDLGCVLCEAQNEYDLYEQTTNT